jgi:hypothetical protein
VTGYCGGGGLPSRHAPIPPDLVLEMSDSNSFHLPHLNLELEILSCFPVCVKTILKEDKVQRAWLQLVHYAPYLGMSHNAVTYSLTYRTAHVDISP